MKTSKRTLLSVFLVIILIALILVFKTFFITNLVDPLTRIFWLIFRSVLSIDQEILWIFLIGITSVVGLLLLPTRNQENLSSAYKYSDKVENRVTFWKFLFSAAEKNSENRQLLADHLENLSNSIQAITGDGEKFEFSPRKSTNEISRILIRLWRTLKQKVSPTSNEFSDIALEKYVKQKMDSLESLMEKQDE